MLHSKKICLQTYPFLQNTVEMKKCLFHSVENRVKLKKSFYFIERRLGYNEIYSLYMGGSAMKKIDINKLLEETKELEEEGEQRRHLLNIDIDDLLDKKIVNVVNKEDGNKN